MTDRTRPAAVALLIAVAALVGSAPVLAQSLSSEPYEEQTGSENPFDGFAVSATPATADLIVGDFDTDGDPDLLAFDGSAERYYENENGSYAERTGPSNPFDGVSPAFGTRTRSFVVDVDDDADVDLIAFEPAGGGTGALRYFENADGETYVDRAGGANPFDGIDVSGTQAVVDAIVGDFDSDADPDLLAYDGSTERYHENDGGTFVERTGGANPFDGISSAFWTRATTLVADFDGDDDVDVAWQNGSQSTWTYLENTDGDTYVERPVGDHPLANVDADATDASLAAVAADFDLDGSVELLADDGTAQQYFDRNESVNYTAQTGDADLFAGVEPAFGVYGTTVVADPDGNGVLDVLWADDGALRYVEWTEPATFDARIDATTSPVVAGETLTVEATVENSDVYSDTRTVTLFDVDGSVADVATVTLDGEANTSVTLAWDTTAEDVGNGTVTVSSSGQNATRSVTVEEAPDPSGPDGSADDEADSSTPTETVNVSVGGATLSRTSVALGETVAVVVELVNEDAVGGTTSVTLRVGGEDVGSTTVFVPAEERSSVTLWHAFDDPGEYAVSVDGVSLGQVTVRDESADPTETASEPGVPPDTPTDGIIQAPTGSPTETTTNESGPGFGVAVVLLAVVVAIACGRFANRGG